MIYFVRHTKPKIEKGICYGYTDCDVDQSFSDEVRIIKHKLGNVSNYTFFSSPLIRCKKLVQELAGDSPIKFDDRLKEMNFGTWEGQIWNNINSEEMKAWSEDIVNNRVPGGERFLDQINRVTDFWKNLDTEKDTVVVAHDGVLRALLIALLDIDKEKVFRINLNYGAIIKIKLKFKHYYKIDFL